MMSVSVQLTQAVTGLFQLLKVVHSIELWRWRYGDSNRGNAGRWGRGTIRIKRKWDRKKIVFFENLVREQRARRKSELVEIGGQLLIAKRSVRKFRLLYPGASITDWTRPEWVLDECVLWWRDVRRAHQGKVGFSEHEVTFPEDIDDWKEEIRVLIRSLVRDELVNAPASERQRIIDEASAKAEVPESIHLIQLGISDRHKLPPHLKEHQVEAVRDAIKALEPDAPQAKIMKHIRDHGGHITDTTLRKILDYLYELGEYNKPRRKKRT